MYDDVLAKSSYAIGDIQHPEKSLLTHMIETGVFAKVFLTHSSYSYLLRSLMAYTDCEDVETFLSSVCFLIALHDIGKTHDDFQDKIHEKECKHPSFRHEEYSRYIIERVLEEKDTDFETEYYLGKVIRNHHQKTNGNSDTAEYILDADYEKEEKQKEIDYFVHEVEKVFPYTPFTIKEGKSEVFCELLCGILRLSDWAASSFEDLDSITADGKIDFEKIENRCEKYLEENDMTNWEPKDHYDYPDLFSFFKKKDTEPRPLQKTVKRAVREHPDTLCMVIQDQPGCGKTEAGVYAAMNLMSSMKKQGLFFCLPTTATTEAMLPRMADLKDTSGAFGGTDLQMFTGTAWMYDGEGGLGYSETHRHAHGPGKLLSKFACCTVDQLMAAGENLKAGDMRLAGLSNKVVIIDEFHAYDAYMMAVLKTVLKWLKEMRVPVIILSATLQDRTLNELYKIYTGKDAENAVEFHQYPLITVLDEKAGYSYPVPVENKKEYKVELINMGDRYQKILESVKSGGNTLYIANTVQKALDLYHELSLMIPKDVHMTLYTARTTPANKAKMGEHLEQIYGKEGKEKGERPQKSIVIATQIMEVSMDVDFDTVFSDLAPMDSLLQRMGRERRHDDKGTVREKGFESIFYVVQPSREKRTWGLPYMECVLNSTEAVLKKFFKKSSGALTIPNDIRNLIEDTYSEKMIKDPEWVQASYAKQSQAVDYLAPSPDAVEYSPDIDMLRDKPVTRVTEYETKRIILLEPEDLKDLEKDKDRHENLELAKHLIKDKSVTIPDYLLEKFLRKPDVQVIDKDASEMCSYLQTDDTLVMDREDYRGPNGIFAA